MILNVYTTTKDKKDFLHSFNKLFNLAKKWFKNWLRFSRWFNLFVKNINLQSYIQIKQNLNKNIFHSQPIHLAKIYMRALKNSIAKLRHRNGAKSLTSLIGTLTFIPNMPLITVNGKNRVEIVAKPLIARFILWEF